MLKLRYRFPFVALSSALLLATAFSAVTFAQSQSDTAPSVAEAARRAREQKKNATKPARTLTDDNLPARAAASAATDAAQPPAKTPDGATPATASDGNPAATAATGTPAAAVKDDAKNKEKKAQNAIILENAKKQLADAEKQLDVLQRKAVLDNDALYSKPDYASDAAGKARLEEDAQSIEDKKTTIEALKAKVAELQALVGEPPPAAEPDKNPPQP